ncbi:MAG TPA: calcium:proton antiporter [Gammaproteobacteria bacterium]|nr:calcium:proton antiporter [Gammaproteobacteria bacterium]
MQNTGFNKLIKILFKERALGILLTTSILIFFLQNTLLATPYHLIYMLIVFLWLFGTILYAEFAIFRHALAVAALIREPWGTLLLTISIVTLEVMLISSVMLNGTNTNPTLARDTLYAIIMVMLNGLLGATLLLGGWRYREQQINLLGAKSFLCVIFLIAVFNLILPAYSRGLASGILSPFLTIFLICVSLIVYGIFLGIQTVRHRRYFLEVDLDKQRHIHKDNAISYSKRWHLLFLLIYLILTMSLINIIAVPIDYAMDNLQAPHALGGLLIAMLVLTPEACVAIRAALCNQLQNAVNVMLGSVLAAIGLIVPAVLVMGLLTGKTVILGVNYVNETLLWLTFIMSILTIGSGRTNVLQGAIHLLIFFAYIALSFYGSTS